VGWTTSPDPPGTFGPGTRAAVEAFQHQRGLRVDGICGRSTWTTLVEASYGLGARLLYERRPMMRGDDVADLQRRLSALGFDTGRVDGIFGPATAAAVAEFQDNVGLPADGIAGTTTIAELLRVTPRHHEPFLVSAVRARERLLTAPRTLAGRTIAVSEAGGLDALVSAVRRRLTSAGARVVPILHPDESQQAAMANAADADTLLALLLVADRPGCRCSYYAGYSYESPGGRRLAELVQELAGAVLGGSVGEPRGMALPVLRETRMPAVVCELGPASAVVRHGADLADALTQALASWVVTPL
jgi:N-acetylmuramoyl-L-alanine amidase